ncbi:MAG: hypothetical protein WD334_02155, partial [Chitinophagales bacterium]
MDQNYIGFSEIMLFLKFQNTWILYLQIKILKLSKATDFFESIPPIQLKHRAAVLAHHIKTPTNIGQILRIAGNAHCDEVMLTYKTQKAADRLIKRTAVNSFGITPFHWVQA